VSEASGSTEGTDLAGRNLSSFLLHFHKPAKINSGDRMLAFLFLLQQRTVVIEWWPRGIIAWLLLGLIAGWLAGKLARGRGFGCLTDIILGLIGSFIGGWVFTKLGIFGGGFLFSLAAATLGAVILVAIVHLFSGGSNN
jgi:uncharacterized membrane protein YeaQ/YmgE (transglycosylase-associated protein family)